jgi:hypothetical protein
MQTIQLFHSILRRDVKVFAVALCLLCLNSCGASDYSRANTVQPLLVKLSDKKWDGVRIPTGQQCKKFAGQGASPAINVSNIPGGTEAIIVEFSDRSWFPMNHGGHGKLGIRLEPGQQTIIIPSVPGETLTLPHDKLFIFHPHRGGRGKIGAYLPPCSGGRGNRYFADIKAVNKLNLEDKTARLLGEGSLFLGSY